MHRSFDIVNWSQLEGEKRVNVPSQTAVNRDLKDHNYYSIFITFNSVCDICNVSYNLLTMSSLTSFIGQVVTSIVEGVVYSS